MKEVLACGRVKAGVFVDHFEGDVTMQDFVIGAIDHAHTALANFGHDAAVA
jgi:hypothetical protein